MKLAGKIAVVTGAGSGIGRALAYELARQGAKLALSDWDEAGLATTVTEARALGAAVHAQRLDVRDRAGVLTYADVVAAHYGAVNLVINNAGIAFSGNVEQMTFEQFEKIMDVDFWGVVNGTKAFLPHLIASGEGHVVNISSLFGLLGMPSQSAYVAAKFAVRGFTETLREEMLIAGHPVGVTCVHPGGIKTQIARNGGAVDGEDPSVLADYFDAKLAKTTAASAAHQILAGVTKSKARVVIGADAKALDAFVRLTGSGYQRVLAKAAKRMMPKTSVAPVSSDRASAGPASSDRAGADRRVSSDR